MRSCLSNRFLQVVRAQGISEESGIDYEEYITYLDCVDELIGAKRSEYLDELLSMVDKPTSDHISILLEDIFNTLKLQNSINCIEKHLFSDNKWRVRTVLDLLEICSKEVFLNLLNTDQILKSCFASNYVDTFVALHCEYESDIGKEILLEAYNSNISVKTKYNIRNLFKTKFKIDLPIYEGFIDYQKEIALKQVSSITESARLDFRNKKYRSVIRKLSQFQESELSPLGKKLLKLANKEIVKK